MAFSPDQFASTDDSALVLNSHQDSVRHAALRARDLAQSHSSVPFDLPHGLTKLMKHGGLYTLMDAEVMQKRIGELDPSPPTSIDPHTFSVKTKAFFTKLVKDQDYLIPTSLMSYLTFPHEGKTFTDGKDEADRPRVYESPDVPAVFTFVGQFIDHDLTMNAINLFVPESSAAANDMSRTPRANDPVEDGASPYIDLDSVYGLRPLDPAPPQPTEIFAVDGSKKTFKMAKVDGVLDLRRKPSGEAYIYDHRNDENQLILQIHILVEQLHNKFSETLNFDDAKRQTILNWQYMVLHDFLPRLVQKDVLDEIVEDVKKPDFGNLLYRPDPTTRRLRMPHEFAIAFRIGHSMLKRAYRLNKTSSHSVLFDNSLAPLSNGIGYDDLRGGQALRQKNRIDWSVFYPRSSPELSNLIDVKVTAPVFDLPESAIPDDIKFVGNLPLRNLIRSREIGLCSGEALADYYKVRKLKPEEVEPDESRWHLFMANEREGAEKLFETPLWYYLLREAELSHNNAENRSKLGPLGSRLISEVIVSSIFLATPSIFTETGFKPISGEPNDHLHTIIEFVEGLASP